MKRPCEDSSSGDSDLDETIDVGCESIYPGHLKASFIRCGSPTTPTQVMARKKRRGIIEKRRRDRINNSLTELRRLVPTAFEKQQGSAKLEKAEILQMTVDHLKVLQATSGKGYLDAHSLALDFLSLGFRECVSEVCRYLGTMETLDPSDPLPSRLLSHLTTCATNRDNTATLTSPHSHGHQYSHNINHFYQFAPPFLPQNWASISGAFRPSTYGLAVSTEAPQQRMLELSQRSVGSPITAAAAAAFPVNFHGGLPVFSQPLLHVNTSNTSPTISSSSSSSQTNKPYRPWGTEVGAF